MKSAPTVPKFLVCIDFLEIPIGGIGGGAEQVPRFFPTQQGIIFYGKNRLRIGPFESKKTFVVGSQCQHDGLFAYLVVDDARLFQLVPIEGFGGLSIHLNADYPRFVVPRKRVGRGQFAPPETDIVAVHIGIFF